MGTNRNRGTLTVAAATLLTGALVGCGSSGNEGAQPSSTTSHASAATTSESTTRTSASDTTSRKPTANASDEALAAIAAGAPPKNLTWGTSTKVPSTWKTIPAQDPGTLQWQVGSRCVVTLTQPSGIGVKTKQTSTDVVKRTAGQTSAAFPGNPKPKYVSWRNRNVTNIVQGLNAVSSVPMRSAIVDYGKVRTNIIGFRDGDFALTYTSACPTAKMFAATSKSDFEPFISKLRAQTSY